MSCKCGDNQAVTQQQLGTFIQRGGCGPMSPMVPALANDQAGADGVKVTGANLSLLGTRNPVYSLDSNRKRFICGYTEEPADQSTVELEWARAGCGGMSTAELSQCQLDVVVGEFCCGGSRLDSRNAGSLLRFQGVRPGNLAYSDLSSHNPDDGELLTISQSATVTDAYRTVELDVNQVVEETNNAIARHHDITYLDGESCTAYHNCDSTAYECGSVWYAIKNDVAGSITYKTPQSGVQQSVALPFYTSGVGSYTASIITFQGRLLVHKLGVGIWSIPLSPLHEPMIDKALFRPLAFRGNGFIACGDNLFLYGGTSTNTERVLKVDRLGFSEVVYNSNLATDPRPFNGTCCGDSVLFSGAGGAIVESRGCDSFIPWSGPTPTVNPIYSIASRVPGEVWYGAYAGGTGVGSLFWTNSRNERSTLALEVAGNIQSLKWATECVGYFVAADTVANLNRIYRTVDGGASWNQIVEIPRGQGINDQLRVPCCENSYEVANSFLHFTSFGIYEAAPC